MYHVLADNIEELEHGVQLTPQDEVASKTLVCFLDGDEGNEILHFGFGYKNGSNLFVVCWENNGRTNKTVSKGELIIAFHEVTTLKARGGNFVAGDFRLGWFTQDARENVKGELIALAHKKERVSAIVRKLPGLTIQELDQVIGKINELGLNN